MLHGYAIHVPEHIRVARFIANEPRLGWAFPLLAISPNIDVLLVGGTVRDAALGREPRDLHAVVRGVPRETLRKSLARQGKTEIHDHGFHFTPAGSTSGIDISLPRTDVYHPRQRTHLTKSHAHISESHDAAWRDFTINGMRYSLREGKLVDPWNGLEHLERGQIVAIGGADKRFTHKPLHALRTLRLASNLGFEPAIESWEASVAHLPSIHHTQHAEDAHTFIVPRPAIGREIIRLLDRNGARGVELVAAADMQRSIFGNFLKDKSTAALAHAERALKNSRLGLSLLTLAYPHETEAQLKLSDLARAYHIDVTSPEWQQAVNALRVAPLLKENPANVPKALIAKLLKGDQGTLALTAARGWAEAQGNHNDLARLYAWERERTRAANTNAKPLLRGRDLIALGFRPGPHLRQLMHDLLDAQLDGRIITTADARAFIRAH